MSSSDPQPKRKLPIAKLAVVALVLLGVGVLLLRGVDLGQLLRDFIGFIRGLGPAVFFLAMAILPAFGFPMLGFTVPAGEAFGAQLGLPLVIGLALLAIAVNLAFGYWIARYALRPVLLKVLKRYGYSVPSVTPENALGITLVVRLTPGPPYAMQAWILGCAEVPFKLYMIVAWLAIIPYALAGIILGEGLFKGNVKAIIMGVGLLVVLGVGVNWARRKYFGRASGA